jgi:hypothetical protein
LSKDIWQGNDSKPLSLNKWTYVEGNPTKFIDPSGKYNREAAVNFALSHDLRDQFPDPGYYDFNSATNSKNPPGWTDCTSFVSSALSAGGVTDNRPNPQEEGSTDSIDPSFWPGYEKTKGNNIFLTSSIILLFLDKYKITL